MFKASAPSSLRDVVSSFAVGEIAYNWPLIAIAMGLLLFAVHLFRQKARAKAQRLQSINLVKVEKKTDEKDAEQLADVGAGSEAGEASAQ